jgi:catechol 2,3-dioxygenase-like lactoylglutathione lyase family enzyme
MPGFRIMGLQVLSLYVSDIARSLDFYTGALGFEKIGEMEPGVTLRSGELTLYIEPGRITRESEPGKHAEFCPCFEPDSVKAAFRELGAAGVTVVEGYREYSPEFAMFKIADPDGCVMEFAGKP